MYNNTFFVKEGIDFIRTNMGGGPMVVENNIIYYNGSAPKEENWFKHTNETKTNMTITFITIMQMFRQMMRMRLKQIRNLQIRVKRQQHLLAGVEAGNNKRIQLFMKEQHLMDINWHQILRQLMQVK